LFFIASIAFHNLQTCTVHTKYVDDKMYTIERMICHSNCNHAIIKHISKARGGSTWTFALCAFNRKSANTMCYFIRRQKEQQKVQWHAA